MEIGIWDLVNETATTKSPISNRQFPISNFQSNVRVGSNSTVGTHRTKRLHRHRPSRTLSNVCDAS